MRKIFPHLGEWLYLLGSILALVAFFLPYWSPLAGINLSPTSLRDCLTSCSFDQFFPQSNREGGMLIVSVIVGVLLLLLLGSVVLAFLVLFWRTPQRRIKTLSFSLSLSWLTLTYYILVALMALLSIWVAEAISPPSSKDVTLIDALMQASIGSWLMLIGLLLTLVGCVFLKHMRTLNDT